jgi:hypothetical protein
MTVIISAIGIKEIIRSGIPPLWLLGVAFMFYWGIFVWARIEITGNLLIDSLLVSMIVLGVSLIMAIGVKTFFALGLKIFPVKTFLLLSAVLSLLFRIFFWARKG